MKKSILIFLTIVCTNIAFAQVSKKTIVEHFTNTKCSICASRNPGLNANLNANSNVLRISIHPSAPYANCFLSQQNTVDNDARTNYYNVYGSTPKLVINGTTISTSQNYADASMFAPFISQSNFSIGIRQYAIGTDSILSEISIKRIATGAPVGSASLFGGLVEDTVFGNGGNGEMQHYNVLRRALFTAQGQVINLPINIGDSVVLNKVEPFSSIWNTSRMRTVAILQEEVSKQLIQSELSSTAQIGATTLINNNSHAAIAFVYPNPANQYITFHAPDLKVYKYVLSNQLGQVVLEGIISHQQNIYTAALNEGIYYLEFYDNCEVSTSKVVVKH